MAANDDSEAPITINGGGTDRLIIDPALPAPHYLPDASGLPGYGRLTFPDGAVVNFSGLEFVDGVAPEIIAEQLGDRQNKLPNYVVSLGVPHEPPASKGSIVSMTGG